MTPRAEPSQASPAAPAPVSKLPAVGTTIFTVMSALATEHDAVNLGQGFPDFRCDPALIDAVTAAMQAGHNQYPPMTGIALLRQRIATKIETLYGRRYDPATEITVTAGATQAIITAVLALVHAGDEVIVIEPVYDSYVPSILLAGGIPVPIRMTPPGAGGGNFTVPWDEVAAAVTPRTRLLIVNSPHNPTGSVFAAADLRALEEIVTRHGLFLISDEVYEHMVFDGARHLSVASYPALAERSVVISSFGKTYHVTGWKIAYAAAPAVLSTEFRKVHQFNVFTVNTPMQHALAAYMEDPAPYLGLSDFYQSKRDYFVRGLAQTRFSTIPCAGTYFQLARYGDIETGQGQLGEADFCQWLTREAKVAAIPVSAFYEKPRESGVVRFCFAKTEATLDRALERLAHL
jgi:methionine aminotransferase